MLSENRCELSTNYLHQYYPELNLNPAELKYIHKLHLSQFIVHSNIKKRQQKTRQVRDDIKKRYKTLGESYKKPMRE